MRAPELPQAFDGANDAWTNGIRQIDVDFLTSVGRPWEINIKDALRKRISREDFGKIIDLTEARLLYGPGIALGHKALVYVGPVDPVVGLGLFAGETIQKGWMIGEYTGIVRPRGSGGSNPYLFDYSPTLGDGLEEYVIDSQMVGNEMRFANHSASHANAAAMPVFFAGRWHTVLVASKEIQPGQKILFDYGAGGDPNHPFGELQDLEP